MSRQHVFGEGTFTLKGSCVESKSVLRVDGGHLVYRRPRPTDSINALENACQRWLGANPTGCLWEITPFSFIVDAFLSIDDVLDTLWLRSQNKYEVEYWSSIKYQYLADLSFAARGECDPDDSYYVRHPVWKVASTDSGCLGWSSYERWKEEPPSLLELVRPKGINTRNGYLFALIALGFLPPGTKARR